MSRVCVSSLPSIVLFHLEGNVNHSMVAHAPLVGILARAALLAQGLIEALDSRGRLSSRGGSSLARILAKLSLQLANLSQLMKTGLERHGDQRLQGVGRIVASVVEVAVLDLQFVEDSGQGAGLDDVVGDLVDYDQVSKQSEASSLSRTVLGVNDGGEGVDIAEFDAHALEESSVRAEAVANDHKGTVKLPVVVGDSIRVDVLLGDGQETLGKIGLHGGLGDAGHVSGRSKKGGE